MTGLGVRIYIDEDVFDDVAEVLRSRRYDAQSCQEAGQAHRGISDEDQLTYVARHGRAILTFNRVDFVRLDVQWKRAARQHAGIIVSHQIRDFGDLLRRIERHLNTYPPSAQDDSLLWLDASSTR